MAICNWSHTQPDPRFSFQALEVNGIKCLTMDGTQSTGKRNKIVLDFNNPSCEEKVLLISDVGTTGVNLQCAHIVIFVVSMLLIT